MMMAKEKKRFVFDYTKNRWCFSLSWRKHSII